RVLEELDDGVDRGPLSGPAHEGGPAILEPGSDLVVPEVDPPVQELRNAGDTAAPLVEPEPALDLPPGVLEDVDDALGGERLDQSLDDLPAELEVIEEALSETGEEALHGAPEAALVPARDHAVPRLGDHVDHGEEQVGEADIGTERALDAVADYVHNL